jgi:Uma2 family endonuclease
MSRIQAMTLNPNPPMTVEAFAVFLALPENRHRLWELIDGETREKMPSQEHGRIVVNVAYALETYARQTQGLVAVEVRHQAPSDTNNSRLPDVSYYLDDTVPLVKEGPMTTYPELVVEVKSPDDAYTEMRVKAHFYLLKGVRVIWLVYPEKRLVEVITADDFQLLAEGETLVGEEWMADFRLPVADVFRKVNKTTQKS